jgi:hypothetical protein
MESRSARSASARNRQHPGPPSGKGLAGDRHWRGDARYAIRCALAFYALAMLIDQGAGTLTLPRAGLWTGLAIRRQAAAAVSGMSGTRSNSLSTPWVASFAM